MKKELLFLLGTASGGLALSAQGGFSSPHRLEDFLKEIDFEARAKQISTEGGMIGTKLPDPMESPQLANGWRLFHESISPGQREFSIKRDGEHLTLIYYYCDDIAAAKSEILDQIKGPTTARVPYQLGPLGLGALSLTGRNNSINTVMFWKKNLVVYLYRYESNIDTLALARWIHDRLTVVPPEEVRRQVPTPQKVTAGQENGGPEAGLVIYPSGTASANSLAARVGESIVIRVTPPSGTPEDRYDLKQEWATGVFQPVSWDGLGRLDRAIRALKPGSAVFKYVLVDRQTLLSYRGEIKIEIQP